MSKLLKETGPVDRLIELKEFPIWFQISLKCNKKYMAVLIRQNMYVLKSCNMTLIHNMLFL